MYICICIFLIFFCQQQANTARVVAPAYLCVIIVYDAAKIYHSAILTLCLAHMVYIYYVFTVYIHIYILTKFML